MKKWFVALVLVAVLSPVFAQEKYTLHYSGDTIGFITIQKDKGGKVTITARLSRFVFIDNSICPLIPEKRSFTLSDRDVIIIDGNTTTETGSTGAWRKTVVDSNTTTKTNSNGGSSKTVVDGNTTMSTNSDGWWEKIVADGNTETVTESTGSWIKTVVDGNTRTATWSDGTWAKWVEDGDTTTETWSNGSWYKTVVSGNTITKTNSYGEKTIIDKQGHNVFITETHAAD